LVWTVASTSDAEHVTSARPVAPETTVTPPADPATSSAPGFTRDPFEPGAPEVRTALDANAATGTTANVAATTAAMTMGNCLRTRPGPPAELIPSASRPPPGVSTMRS